MHVRCGHMRESWGGAWLEYWDSGRRRIGLRHSASEGMVGAREAVVSLQR